MTHKSVYKLFAMTLFPQAACRMQFYTHPQQFEEQRSARSLRGVLFPRAGVTLFTAVKRRFV